MWNNHMFDNHSQLFSIILRSYSISKQPLMFLCHYSYYIKQRLLPLMGKIRKVSFGFLWCSRDYNIFIHLLTIFNTLCTSMSAYISRNLKTQSIYIYIYSRIVATSQSNFVDKKKGFARHKMCRWNGWK